MLRRAACIGVAVAMGACSKPLVLNDLWDTGVSISDAGGGRDGSTWTPPEAGSGCFERTRGLVFEPQSADIMIVLDRSLAMQGAFPAAPSKQVAVKNALDHNIPEYQSHINFGLELFPADARNKSSQCSRTSCCADGPTVPPTPNAFGSLSDYLQCSDQQGCQLSSGDSPSQKALDQVLTYYYYLRKTSWSSDGQVLPAYVVLITASDPSCNTDTSGPDACSASINTAGSLGKMDIPVVVLGVGYQTDKTTDSCLGRLSRVGSVSSMPGGVPRLYTPGSVGDLDDALAKLFGAIAQKSCTLSAYIPAGATLQTLSIGSTAVTQDELNGWAFNGTNRSQIKLSGWACGQYLQSPQGTYVTGSYSCSTCPGPNACGT